MGGKIMPQKMELNVVGAQGYSFNDDKNGRLVEGVNVFHLVDGDITNGSVGLIPSKITWPYDAWGKISSFKYPVKCEVKTEQVFTKKGIVTKVVDLEPLVLVK